MQPLALPFGKSAFGTDQDRDRSLRQVQRRNRSCLPGLVAKDQVTALIPIVQVARKLSQLGDLRHECRPALFGRLDRVSLKPVPPHALRISVFRLHWHDTGSAKFDRLFDDEIGAGFLDRREQQPEVGRHLLGCSLFLGLQHPTAFSGLRHGAAPRPVAAIEDLDLRARPKPHDSEEIARLPRIQRHRLSRLQRVIYIKARDRSHGCIGMTGSDDLPDTPDPAPVADAVRGNWVDRIAPPATRPYLRLSRADRPIGTWLLLIPCWWGLLLAMLHDGRAGWGDLWIATGCALGAFLMRGAGCTWNDITDRKIDAKVARTRSRPIPSGQVGVRAALAWMLVQTLVSLLILLTFNGAAILLGFVALVPVAIYPFAKRFTWWPQVFLGLAFNWGALLAWTAHTGSLGAPAVVLYCAGIAWTLFYDTIYAHQDTEDDALIGVKSTARLFGTQSPAWLRRFLMATVMLMGLAVIYAGIASNPLALVVALGGPWAMGWHMAWQLRRFDAQDGTVLLQLFRSNRDAGLIASAFFAGALLL